MMHYMGVGNNSSQQAILGYLDRIAGEATLQGRVGRNVDWADGRQLFSCSHCSVVHGRVGLGTLHVYLVGWSGVCFSRSVRT